MVSTLVVMAPLDLHVISIVDAVLYSDLKRGSGRIRGILDAAIDFSDIIQKCMSQATYVLSLARKSGHNRRIRLYLPYSSDWMLRRDAVIQVVGQQINLQRKIPGKESIAEVQNQQGNKLQLALDLTKA